MHIVCDYQINAFSHFGDNHRVDYPLILQYIVLMSPTLPLLPPLLTVPNPSWAQIVNNRAEDVQRSKEEEKRRGNVISRLFMTAGRGLDLC